MLRIRAGRIYPVTAPPIVDGAVLVAGTRIVAVGPDAEVPSPPPARSVEFPDSVLVPGLVNCHTHLELTHLGSLEHAEFPEWIRAVRERKDATAPEAFTAAAEDGLRDCWARGVTCVADTGSSGAVLDVLARLGGRGTAYHEVFGPDPEQATASFAELEAAVARLNPLVSDLVRLGLSPHAPYTVSPPLYRAVAAMARLQRFPVAVHLAESRAEVSLVREGTGPFADAWRARNIPAPPRGMSPVSYLQALGVLGLGPACLCIHCVHVDSTDVTALSEAGVAVAVCPRSNLAHGHGAPPVAAFRQAGVPLGFGTDSVVSVPDLDLWAEAEAAGLGWLDALTALTLDGARAIGWHTEIGSLERGKAADLAVFPGAGDPPRPSRKALLTLVAGRAVHRRGPIAARVG